MSVLPPSTTDLIQMPPEPVRRLSVAEYHQMIKAGILQEDDPFEMLEGWLLPKMTRNAPHDLAVGLADDEIGKRLRRGFTVVANPRSRQPIVSQNPTWRWSAAPAGVTAPATPVRRTRHC